MCPPVPQKGLQTFEQGSNLLHLCKSQAPTNINCIKENVNKRWKVELTIHIIATVWCLNATENRSAVCDCTGLKWRRQKETCREPGSLLHRMMLMSSMSKSDRLWVMLGVRFLIFIWLHLPVHECLIPFLHLLICRSTNIQNHDQGSNISRDFKFLSPSLMSCLRNCRQQMQQYLGSKDIVSHKRNSRLPAGDHHTTVWKQKAANCNRHQVGSNVSNPINIHVSSTQWCTTLPYSL
jgi:hypothetical protein